MKYSMNMLYKTIGISKQAVHQAANRQKNFDGQIHQLCLEADQLRDAHPGCGVEKMHQVLKPDFIGRDRFVDTMMGLGYRLKKKKNYRKTTIAAKKFYPNLIKGLKVDSPSTVWQSDITYIPIENKHYYAVFIIDVYTKKIVGYQVSDHMRATANVKALEMALKEHKAPLIHHSDRGSQYTYKQYIELLKQENCQISMSGSAQNNAYAERINRTIKEEYLAYWKPKDFKSLIKYVKMAVNNYNNTRPHANIEKMNPVEFEKMWSKLTQQNRPDLLES